MKKSFKIVLAILCCTVFTFGAILLWNFYYDALAAVCLFAALCSSCIAFDKEDRANA